MPDRQNFCIHSFNSNDQPPLMKKQFTYSDFRQMYAAAEETVQQFRNIDETKFHTKPAPSAWSAAEICSHIIQFNRLYVEQMQMAQDDNEVKSTADKPFSPGYFVRKYAAWLEPPYKMKLKTLKPFYPEKNSDSESKENILNRLIDVLSATIDFIDSCEARNVHADKTTGRNPLLRFLPMSLTEFLVLMDAHQRRHFWQIEVTIGRVSEPES
jgi:hypothetical protein